MAIKVLHVFAPNYKSRFGGPSYNWRYYFFRWNDLDVAHYVLDSQNNQLIDSKEAFNFEYSDVQKKTPKWERIVWIFTLFRTLITHKGKYDILHLHVLWWGTLLVGPWAKWNNIPALYESVLLDADTPGGVNKEKFGGLKICCMKTYKAILAISGYLAEDYRSFGFSNKQIFILMNCVDMDLFLPLNSAKEKLLLREKLNLPKSATILIFVGSVTERKGADILIRAFIGSSSKRSDLYLLIVGPKNKNENPSVDEDFTNNLYSLLKKNNKSERVFFTGLIQNRQKLAEIYRASDIFVFPSRNEGLPNVVLEAMASELPVVVSQLPGLEKTIQNKENGVFVPIGDADALRDSILALSSDPSLQKKMGLAAHNYIREAHSFIVWQSQLVGFYKELRVEKTGNRQEI